jgi:hypothetical protein
MRRQDEREGRTGNLVEGNNKKNIFGFERDAVKGR